MLSVALIELLSNFRRSQYDNSNVNLFQANLLAIIAINFILVVVGTNNFYSERAHIHNVDADTPWFWLAVFMALLFTITNVVIITYYNYKIETEYSIKMDKGEVTTKWMWDESIIKSMVNEM